MSLRQRAIGKPKQQQPNPASLIMAPDSSSSSSSSSTTSPWIERIQSIPVYVKLSSLLLAGTILGICMPKNPILPSIYMRYISSIIGYTYFLSWSISFYPQVILNFRRQTTVGLSPDFSILNVMGFLCYSIYVGCFFFSDTIQHEYQQRFGSGDDDAGGDNDNDNDNGVQSNDVAFAFHALFLSTVQVCQIIYYDYSYSGDNSRRDGRDDEALIPAENNVNDQSLSSRLSLKFQYPLATWTKYFLIGSITLIVGEGIVILTNTRDISWLDYLYMLSSIKLTITIIKYIPQVVLNYQRKSTVGWNVYNVLLDLAGGILSILQMFLDAWDMNDYTAITGNFIKFGLGFVSIFFDIVFIIQHYILYPHKNGNSRGSSMSTTSESSSLPSSSGVFMSNTNNREEQSIPLLLSNGTE